MDISFFTRRYVDRSKNTGFQFEFFCDKCNKGHLTPFRIHALGVVTSIWDATDWKKEKEKDFDFDTLKKDVSRLFLKGKAWIEAYTNAVEEAQKYFKHCARCLKWVCPKTCFNPRANLCQGCAPLTEAEKAALKAEERRKESGSRTKEPAEAVDAPRVCPHCGASNPVATFCADCGGKVVQDIFCPGCGCKWSTEKKMKFCPRCGDEMPEIVPRGVKPTIVKSDSEKRKGAERAAERAADPFADISSEVKKVAEEYKNLAEDLLGLKPRKSEPPKPASTKPASTKASEKPAGEKIAGEKTDGERPAAEKPMGEKKHSASEATAKPSHLSSVKPAPVSKSSEDESEKPKPKSGRKAKPQTKKVTKITKVKRPTAQKKSAPAAKKPKPQPQPKAKAKKKPKPKS